MDALLKHQRPKPRETARSNNPDGVAEPTHPFPGERLAATTPSRLVPQTKTASRRSRAVPDDFPTTALGELCEPLFLYVCKLHRWTRRTAGAPMPGVALVRSNLQQLLRQIQHSAHAAGQGEAFAEIRGPLVYFVDGLMTSDAMPFAADWPRLAHDENAFTGDADFFTALDETLSESDRTANDRLSIFYTCLGLGFEGKYRGQPDYIEVYLTALATRLRAIMDRDTYTRVCPDAYDQTDRRLLTRPVAARVGSWFLLSVLLLGLSVAGSGVLYVVRTRQLRSDLASFIHSTPGAVSESSNRPGR